MYTLNLATTINGTVYRKTIRTARNPRELVMFVKTLHPSLRITKEIEERLTERNSWIPIRRTFQNQYGHELEYTISTMD